MTVSFNDAQLQLLMAASAVKFLLDERARGNNPNMSKPVLHL